MAITRWDPFRDIVRMQNDMSRLLRGFDEYDSPVLATSTYAPVVDIVEREGELMLSADLPGLSKEDIDISVENRTLTLTGERHSPEAEGTTVYRAERPYGRFTRTFALPAAVDLNNIRADYNAGVLTVVLPKVEEARPRRIEIGAR